MELDGNVELQIVVLKDRIGKNDSCIEVRPGRNSLELDCKLLNDI